MSEKKRMISEAARELNLETHTLRTWEEEFELSIPRNQKGYRFYGDGEVALLARIRDWKAQGLSVEEMKTKIKGNSSQIGPASGREQDKMLQFQNVMAKIVGQAMSEQKEILGREISSQVADQVSMEIDYQFHIREEAQEQRFKKIDELIRIQQKAREELAVSRERRRFFHKKRK